MLRNGEVHRRDTSCLTRLPSPEINIRPVQFGAMGAHFSRAVVVLLLVGILFVDVSSASAAVPILEWTRVSGPGDEDLLVVTPSEVTGVAAGRNGVVYAIDGENGRMYRSLNYGLDWEDITRYLERAEIGLPATMVAVAPDNEGIVAVVADGGTSVWASLDGGCEWEDTQLPAIQGEVSAIDISSRYTHDGREYREFAVGTAFWGDGDSNGEVLVARGGETWSGWRDQAIRVDPDSVGADVSALKYSSSYGFDRTLVVVASTGSDVAAAYRDRTWVVLGERDMAAVTTSWDSHEAYGYPLELIDAGDAVGVEGIRSSLALPSDYNSVIPAGRNLFVSVDRTPDHDDDVYRVEGGIPGDEVVRMNVDGGVEIEIWSIAYRGTRNAGILLAGERQPIAPSPDDTNVQVWRCEAPYAGTPQWQAAQVPPTGPAHAVLAWAPGVSLAYCGTSSQPGVGLDESAFSASGDGSHWRQMGLIDTELTMTDLAVAPGGEKLFLTTSNEYGPESVWHSFSDPLGQRWERVLTVDSETDAVVVTLSPNYEADETLYIAVYDSDVLAVSHDRGNSWQWRRTSPEVIRDLLVVDENTLIAAIPGGRVMRSTNSGRSWEDAVDTGLDEINMLARAADGTLFVGGRDGHVAYSHDGRSFVLIDEPVGPGDIHVLPDISFDRNGWIYAASSGADEGLWRWKIGVSTSWRQLDEDVTLLGAGQQVGGLLIGSEGTLYAIRMEPAINGTGGMTRWLCPACEPCVDHEHDHVVAGLPAGTLFADSPLFDQSSYPVGSLWGDDEKNDVFAIDTQEQRILVFRDTLSKRGPYLDSPEDGAHLDEDPCPCVRGPLVTFDWEKLERVGEYEVRIYYDAAVATWLWSGLTDYEGIVLSPVQDSVDLRSGAAYGWRVRTTAPLLSPWSDMWRFYPLLLDVTDLSPAPGSMGVATRPVFTWSGPGSAEAYEFVLAADSEFEHVIAAFVGDTALHVGWWGCDVTLAHDSSYFWRVRGVTGTLQSPWAYGVFTTESQLIEEDLPPPIVVEISRPSPAVPDALIWTMFVLGVLLMCGLIVLVLRTGRR